LNQSFTPRYGRERHHPLTVGEQLLRSLHHLFSGHPYRRLLDLAEAVDRPLIDLVRRLRAAPYLGPEGERVVIRESPPPDSDAFHHGDLLRGIRGESPQGTPQ